MQLKKRQNLEKVKYIYIYIKYENKDNKKYEGKHKKKSKMYYER
jgi:hypothetical protein